MSQTTVVNIRTLPQNPLQWPPDHVYIGRQVLGGGYRLRHSIWRNPFAIGRDGSRELVIAAFEAWLRERPPMLARLPELRGKTLVCWCTPEACHGDVLARLADAVPAVTT